MEDLISYLLESDFFEAPASTKYHSAYVGGLCEHSYKVFELLYRKNKLYKLGIPEDSIIISALLHDFCKIDFYKIIQKWRKDDKGKWESYDTYGYTNKFPMGHGEKSVICIMKFIELTEQEMLMVRWHMGSHNNDPFISGEAMSQEKGIAALHSADLEASFLFEKRGE